ncbi:MAG: hypothetical protein K5883_04925 [Pseudobutyrivibrio sp.]|nr:hypothetical protein [Pseudobutyrivibrio sp.]
MKLIKARFGRIFASIFLIFLILISPLPQISITAQAANSTYTLENESFIPSRSFYPYYISIYSSCKSNLIKGIWERVLYEENNYSSYNNKGTYGTWAQEYYTGAAVNYISSNGASTSWQNINFSTNSGDFDIFLGNTLEANPEMLGEMLGLRGYTAVSSKTGQYSQASLLDTYRKVIYEKLASPEKYKSFAKSMVSLTKYGKYLSDGALSSAAYNGKTFDYWMLCTLAYFYEGDGSETYLSQKQVAWLENYAPTLVNEYVGSGATSFNGVNWIPSGTSLAGKYKPIYNLIARSSAGVNNSAKNKEFFNYVVSSGTGAGTWLNRHNSINIARLNNFDNLTNLFAFSDGWCGGLCANVTCHSHTATCYKLDNCKSMANSNDLICVQLHRNPTADDFLKSNQSILNVYGADANQSDTWQFRHRVKHTNYSNSGSETKSIRAAEYADGAGIRVKMIEDADGQEWEYVKTTAVIDLAKVLANSNAPQTVSVTFFYEGNPNSDFDDHDTKTGDIHTTWLSNVDGIYSETPNEYYRDIGENPPMAVFDRAIWEWVSGADSRYATYSNIYNGNVNYPTLYTGPENVVDTFRNEHSSGTIQNQRNHKVYEWNDMEGSTHASFRTYTFNISNLTKAQLEQGYIAVTSASLCHATSGDEYCAIGLFHYITIEDKINDCDINGHQWKVKNNSDVVWANDYSSVNITYTCDKKISERRTCTIKTTPYKSSDGKTITYRAAGLFGDNYTRVKNSSAGSSGTTKTINLSSNNVEGTSPTDSDSSDSTVWPGGAKSSTVYKQATSNICFRIRNQIPAGTQKLQFYYYSSENLRELNIEVLSNGKIIGQGGLTKPTTIDKVNGIVTITLSNNSDEDLNGCYVNITGEAHTFHEVPVGTTPSRADSKIGITKMVLYF